MSTNLSSSLSLQQRQSNKKHFAGTLARTNPNIPDAFYHYLELSDFYKAPASTQYHQDYEGGLVEHSLMVYEKLMQLNYQYLLGYPDSTISKVALLHDICKVDFYKRSRRNKRLEDGTWVRMDSWEVDDHLPLGHGEKSVIILLQHKVPLDEEEMLAIRWHMGGFDASARDYAASRALSNAMGQSKLVTALHLADMMAVWL